MERGAFVLIEADLDGAHRRLQRHHGAVGGRVRVHQGGRGGSGFWSRASATRATLRVIGLLRGVPKPILSGALDMAKGGA